MVSLILPEANFCLTVNFQGDKTTTYGAIRASLGYPNPFTTDYVEIGNEDYFNGGSPSYYSYRFDAFYNAIHAAYPSLHLISTIKFSMVGLQKCFNTPL